MEIKGYKIHGKIGEGAMASVFLAEQESLGREVALKVLAPELAGRSGFTERFFKEGKIIAYLKHPQIVSIYDLGSHHHSHYMSMELLAGGTLDQKIKAGLSRSQSVQLIIQIGEALRFAHDNGVIHRDIKSQNIMFRDDGIPVLTDFGIARLMDNDPELTIPGRTVGSPSFMSPEQISGDVIDTRADLYSVGVLFYKMLTQELPYRSDHFLDIAIMHKTAPIPILPEELSLFQPVLNKLLAKSPDERYPCVQDMINVLKPIHSEMTPDLSDSTPIGRPTKISYRMPAIAKMDRPVAETHGATQPALEQSSERSDDKWRSSEETVAQNRPEEEIHQSVNEAPSKPQGKTMWKIGAIMTGSLMAFVIGLFIADRYDTGPSGSPLVATSSSNKSSKPIDFSSLEQDVEQAPVMKAAVDSRTPVEQKSSEKSKPLMPAQPTVEEKIKNLMAKARRQLANQKITLPKGDNCYETYQQLHALAPNSQEAQSILAMISEAYRDMALTAKLKGNFDLGLRLVGKGLSVSPKDSALLAMRNDLRTKLDERERLRAKQALRIEQQKAERAAELAAIQKKLKALQEQEMRRREEAERKRAEEVTVKPTETKPQEVKKEDPPSEETSPPFDGRKRLFGTF